mmetsp:Transcript_738/g.1154  ORF Transcript_738/g.1154 Transcript_738/m.1154 type:complete len:407 (+) Transcript_738:3-1223(+)
MLVLLFTLLWARGGGGGAADAADMATDGSMGLQPQFVRVIEQMRRFTDYLVESQSTDTEEYREAMFRKSLYKQATNQELNHVDYFRLKFRDSKFFGKQKRYARPWIKARGHERLSDLLQSISLSNQHNLTEQGRLLFFRGINFPDNSTASDIRRRCQIRVKGNKTRGSAPRPLLSFMELYSRYQCSRLLVDNIGSFGIQIPTPVQRQAIPCLLSGRDLLCTAPTGSGKTLAFLVPAIHIVDCERRVSSNKKLHPLRVCVMSPTAELTTQSWEVCNRVCRDLGIKSTFLDRAHAAGSDFGSVDILLAQPLRLVTLTERSRISLKSLRFLVVDEVDRMLDLQFSDQLDDIISQVSDLQGDRNIAIVYKEELSITDLAVLMLAFHSCGPSILLVVSSARPEGAILRDTS